MNVGSDKFSLIESGLTTRWAQAHGTSVAAECKNLDRESLEAQTLLRWSLAFFEGGMEQNWTRDRLRLEILSVLFRGSQELVCMHSNDP